MKRARRLRFRQATGTGQAIYAERNNGVWAVSVPGGADLFRYPGSIPEAVVYLATLAEDFGGAVRLDVEDESGAWRLYDPKRGGRPKLKKEAA